MKKAVSILVAILIALCPASVFAQAFSANEKNIPSFTASVKEIVSSYNHVPKGKISSEIYNKLGSGINTGRLIVKSSRRINSKTAVMKATGFMGYTVFQYGSVQDAIEAYITLSSLKYVESVEPDVIVKLNDSIVTDAPDPEDTNDTDDDDNVLDPPEMPREYLSWGAYRSDFDVLNKYIKDEGKELSEVVIGYVDTGIDDTVPILNGRVTQSNYNTSGEGDENISFDDCGHGTNGASLIADITNNNVKFISYKCLDYSGSGTLLGIAACILKAVEDDVDIINLSLGAATKSVMGDAIIAAEKKDIIVSAAAGNFSYNMDKIAFYPGCIKSVINVSSINESLELSDFSNYGSSVDLTAAGEHVLTYGLNGELEYVDGTSFAAPHVSAACAMVLGMYPEMPAKIVEKLLKENAVTLPGGKDEKKFGSGLVNVEFLTRAINISSTEIADYTKVLELIDTIENEYDTNTLAIYYTNKSAKALLKARYNVLYNLPADEQKTVNGYEAELNEALNGLKKANFLVVFFRIIIPSIPEFKAIYWTELF